VCIFIITEKNENRFKENLNYYRQSKVEKLSVTVFRTLTENRELSLNSSIILKKRVNLQMPCQGASAKKILVGITDIYKMCSLCGSYDECINTKA
jgi:hypothetical protein